MPRKKSRLNEAQIIEAVYSLMDHYNYHEITVDMIAEKAGLSKRTLYSYYPSKDAIFALLYEGFLKELYDTLLDLEKTELYNEEIICAIFETLNSFSEKNRKYHKLLWFIQTNELGFQIPDEIAEYIAIWNESIHRLNERIIEARVVSGFFSTVSVDLLSQMLSVVNKGIIMQGGRSKVAVGFDAPSAGEMREFFCALFRAVGKTEENRTFDKTP